MIINNIKVVHLATTINGGAGRSALRLHNAMLSRGVASSFISLDPFLPGNEKLFIYSWNTFANEIALKSDNRLKKILKRFWKVKQPILMDEALIERFKNIHGQLKCEIASIPYAEIEIWDHPLVKDADIINLHWVAGMINYPAFFKYIKRPVLWTFHDMQPFSGLFHYSNDAIYNEYLCHSLTHDIIGIKTKAILSFKKPLAVVTPSRWLAKEALKSKVFENVSLSIIPYSIDPKIFKLQDKIAARGVLGLPTDGIIILFVAQYISNYRKGFDLLLNALKILDNKKNFHFVALGNTIYTDFPEDIKVITPGHINSDKELSLHFAAADVFILPSREDNLPNTLLESLMCGTPVISFKVGGISEHIIPFKTGILANELSGKALADAIQAFLDNPNLFDRQEIHEYAKMHFLPNRQVEAYLELFEKLLHQK